MTLHAHQATALEAAHASLNKTGPIVQPGHALIVEHQAAPLRHESTAPMLLAGIDHARWDHITQPDLQRLSWGSALLGGTPMLYVKVQYGANLVQVVADPSCTHTWTFLDRANKAGQLCTGATTQDDEAMTGRFAFELTPPALAMRALQSHHTVLAPLFDVAAQALLQGLAVGPAVKPLGPEMPAIKHVHRCVLGRHKVLRVTGEPDALQPSSLIRVAIC